MGNVRAAPNSVKWLCLQLPQSASGLPSARPVLLWNVARVAEEMPTSHDLKSRLWDCAQTLRGSAVDRTDWKAYILPLLFFKLT